MASAAPDGYRNEGDAGKENLMKVELQCDIAVIGAGAAGLIAAIALARSGHAVALVGRKPPPLHGRTVALFEGSLRDLAGFGLAQAVEGPGAPVTGMRIVDDTGSLFSPGPTFYRAQEIGLERFGVNIPNDALVAALDGAAADFPGLERIEAFAQDYAFDETGVSVGLDDGRALRARLIVAGDGRNSRARQAAGIEAGSWTYPQVALTAILRHRRPHEGVTTEYHTRSGPFTFVPMPSTATAAHRSSLVWLVRPEEAERLLAMDRDALGAEISAKAHYRFGAVRIEGEIGHFPMGAMRTDRVTAPRLMLVGEACHVFPPLAAQGLNLGIRDSADAARLLDGIDLADDAALSRALADYETSRKADIETRTLLVDLLNRSLLNAAPPVDLLRAVGMAAAANIGPLRRAVLNEGVDPALAGRLKPIVALARRLF